MEWNQISNNVKPGGNFVVLDLEPATWYNVRITAHNSAGFTVAEYEFATLTVTGGIYILFNQNRESLCEKCTAMAHRFKSMVFSSRDKFTFKCIKSTLLMQHLNRKFKCRR